MAGWFGYVVAGVILLAVSGLASLLIDFVRAKAHMEKAD